MVAILRRLIPEALSYEFCSERSSDISERVDPDQIRRIDLGTYLLWVTIVKRSHTRVPMSYGAAHVICSRLSGTST